ncbi:MAG: adenylate/guanylate cyclase domain-containing protein, partial [Nitrospirae bacterium]|nr:adenylate/guanylate cyclase domain-containing protein [Nitrospirota bacterium]
VLVEAAERLNGWTVLLDRYKALLDGVRRTEILEVLQHRVHLLTTEAAASEEDILFSQGRLFRFGETEQVVNNARAATILFADVRGFTRLSEKGFSEKELTESLYRIFDPIAEIVTRFGGRIDKFIGDGVMITFGVPIPRREDPLMGLRTAVMMQRHLDGLRRQGKTDLKMGIALHTGRVFVAEFMGCQGQVHRTVIGRNVNLAGRLSSPKQPPAPAGESDEFRTMIHSLAESLGGAREAEGFKQFVSQRYLTRRMVSGVSVDSRGQLFNVGIVVSQDTVDEIRRVVASDAGGEETRHFSFSDEVLGQRIVLEFVGDVVLEGVEKSVSVHSVLF